MKRSRLCRVVPAVFLLAAAGCWPEDPKPGLDGVWAGTTLITSDGKQDDYFARTIRWTIEGDKISISDARVQEAIHGTFKVDNTQDPKTIDAEGKGGGSFAWMGIYEQNGDTLKVTYVPKNAGYYGRPQEFDSKSAYRITLKRIVK